MTVKSFSQKLSEAVDGLQDVVKKGEHNGKPYSICRNRDGKYYWESGDQKSGKTFVSVFEAEEDLEDEPTKMASDENTESDKKPAQDGKEEGPKAPEPKPKTPEEMNKDPKEEINKDVEKEMGADAAVTEENKAAHAAKPNEHEQPEHKSEPEEGRPKMHR